MYNIFIKPIAEQDSLTLVGPKSAAVKPENEINRQQHKYRTVINHNKRTDLERSVIINFHCGSKLLFVRLVERSSNSLRNAAISQET